MLNNIIFSANPTELDIETVEKKGAGHPDSMADAVAEELASVINDYFLSKYGVIPRYNADLVSIFGGDVEFDFGRGRVNKKATIDLGGNMPYLDEREIAEIRSIAEQQIYAYLTGILPFNAEDLFQINWRVNCYSAQNAVFFQGNDHQGHSVALAEDTVVAYGFCPYSDLEQLTLDTSQYMNDLSREYPIGSDTKIMSIRHGIRNEIGLIISIGFKALEIQDYEDYSVAKENVRDQIEGFARERIPDDSTLSVTVNAADDAEQQKGYYLFSGSAAEHDKGTSGKGNHLSGVMTPFRYHSFESVFGKNPAFHAGKIYNVLSFLLAQEIAEQVHSRVDTIMVSQIGAPLSCPRAINILTPKKLSDQHRSQVSNLVGNEMQKYFTASEPHPNLMKISEEILRRGNLTQFKIHY
ncbi:hypothetical protein KKF55_02515 [Patescibacteria group bacterium]|nr:hypothetical protein [Patescibacteria group bacterium]